VTECIWSGTSYRTFIFCGPGVNWTNIWKLVKLVKQKAKYILLAAAAATAVVLWNVNKHGRHKALAWWPQTWKTWNTQGFLWTWKTRNSVQPQGKIVTNKVFLVRHSNIWSECGGVAVVDVEWHLMKVIITFTFCCDNLWKSKFMVLEKPGKTQGIFFSYSVATPVS